MLAQNAVRGGLDGLLGRAVPHVCQKIVRPLSVSKVVGSTLQSKRVTAAIESHRSSEGERDLSTVPEITQQYVSQALDISYNFPSAVLTLLAFWHMYPGELTYVALLVMAVVVGVFFRSIISPKLAPAYARWTWRNFSVVTAVLIFANGGGLAAAIISAIHT